MLAISSNAMPAPDSGLASLVLMLQFLGMPADPEQLRHRRGGVRFGATEILRSAADLGVKARRIETTWERLGKTALPAIAARRDGEFVIVAKWSADKVIIHNSASGKPEMLARVKASCAPALIH